MTQDRVSFFFQAEDGIRYWSVTGVQTCALPISNTKKDSSGGEDPVPCEGDRTEVNVRIEGKLNQSLKADASRVLSPARGRALAAPCRSSHETPTAVAREDPRLAHNPLAGATRDASRGLPSITFHGTS